MGIEPTSKAWEAFVLPLNYTRDSCEFYDSPASSERVMGMWLSRIASARLPSLGATLSGASGPPARYACRRPTNSPPDCSLSNPRLKLGKLSFYH